MVRSINSAPGNASPSTFGSTLLHIPAGITPQGRPLCAHVFSLCFLHFDGLHSLHLVRRWLQVRTPMQTLRFEFSPLHFCSPPLTETPPTAEPLWSRTPRVKRAAMNSPQARPCGGFLSRGLYIMFLLHSRGSIAGAVERVSDWPPSPVGGGLSPQ